ncbi:MAG TPA: tryptophan 2,3-dioxygenase family protein [Phycisphaerae bacterium]|nr:tryptophan 2,3-dioxygenase family protein [Phycisphaerae bacterium]HRW56005.1 tryptophan 2,3-dioxygenase family protein [Phycisphaerae bacterium]
MALTYGEYLKLDALLTQQHVMSDPEEHDELLFIVIHQVYELWFKLTLHEFDKLCADLTAGRLFGAISTLQRVRTIMKTLVGQLDILETMTPMSFNSFRDRLETSSGFQSAQFREFEFALGNKRREMMKPAAADAEGVRRIEKRLHAKSLVDHFYDFLETLGVQIPAELKNKPVTEPTRADERIQDEILKLYRTRPDVAILLELMTDFDEGLQEWRYRHVKLVERTIGNKQGTGGSLGVEFLKRSLFQPVFPDLWAVRHRL